MTNLYYIIINYSTAQHAVIVHDSSAYNFVKVALESVTIIFPSYFIFELAARHMAHYDGCRKEYWFRWFVLMY